MDPFEAKTLERSRGTSRYACTKINRHSQAQNMTGTREKREIVGELLLLWGTDTKNYQSS
nr:hypothetical protein [Rhodococcus rhodochrous]